MNLKYTEDYWNVYKKTVISRKKVICVMKLAVLCECPPRKKQNMILEGGKFVPFVTTLNLRLYQCQNGYRQCKGFINTNYIIHIILLIIITNRVLCVLFIFYRKHYNFNTINSASMHLWFVQMLEFGRITFFTESRIAVTYYQQIWLIYQTN